MTSFLIRNRLLALIILIAFLLRFYQLGQNPPSLNWDEASNGYNAYSILKTARDEYGNFLPLTFRAFGDYNPALSVYTLVPSIAAFGLNEFAVRFPSALLGTLSVLVFFPLIRKLTNNTKLSLLSSLFLAISPWHIQFSRYDHEANFMLFFVILGLTCLVSAFKKFPLLLISSVSFSLALNSYQGAKIWLPLILLLSIFWFRKELIKFGAKLFLPLLILFISTIPIISNLQNSLIRANSVSLLQNDHKFKTFITGYLSHFAPNFLFISGDTIGRHSVSGMGQLYLFELPLIILGLIKLIGTKTRSAKFFLTWFLVAPIPAALATPTPHALRSITFLPLWSILAAFGIGIIVNSNIQKNFKKLIIVLLTLTALYNISSYLHLYYNHYPKEKALDWQVGYEEMVKYVDNIKNNYDTIVVSNFYGRPYIYVLFYTRFNPKLYHPQSQNKTKFDKYEFFGESWEKKTQGKVLLVRPDWQKPDPPPKYIKYIYSENGQLVFRISEE